MKVVSIKLYLRLLLLAMIVGAALMPSAIYADDSTTSDSDHSNTSDSDTDKSTTTKTNQPENETKDKDNDGVDDEVENAYEREVQIETSNHELQIQSQIKSGENKDKIEIQLQAQTGDLPQMELKYKTEGNASESELKFKVEFDQIVEYVENGTLLGYQQPEFVSSYLFSEAEWVPFNYTSDVVNGSTIYKFNLATTDGVFTVHFAVTTGIVVGGNYTLTPNSLKFDVEINGFPYTANASSLALLSNVKTEQENERKENDHTDEEAAGFGQNEAEVKIGNANASGFFSWSEYAVADNQLINVDHQIFHNVDEDANTDEAEDQLVFSFIAENASNIYWDPKIGVTSQATETLLSILNAVSIPSPSNLSVLPGYSFLLALFAVAVPVILRKIQK